jgi:prevent-host-death family protein
MTQVNLHEAKAALSALVERAAAGEDIIIAKNGRARARLTAVSAEPPRPVRWGMWDHYGWKLPRNFDGWDDDLDAMFYSGSQGAPSIG